MLKITTEGRKAALDLRLVLPHVRDNPDSKTNHAVEKISRDLAATRLRRKGRSWSLRSFTLQPGGRGFSVYAIVRANCSRAFLPTIAFVQEYDNERKPRFSKRCAKERSASSSGSTPKMGRAPTCKSRLQVHQNHATPQLRAARFALRLAWSPVGSSNRLPQNTAPVGSDGDRQQRYGFPAEETRKVIPRAAGADKARSFSFSRRFYAILKPSHHFIRDCRSHLYIYIEEAECSTMAVLRSLRRLSLPRASSRCLGTGSAAGHPSRGHHVRWSSRARAWDTWS